MMTLVKIRCFPRKLWRSFSTKPGKVLKSKLPDITLPNVPVHEHIFRNINRWEDKTALVCQQTGRSYKYHDLWRRSRAVASFLRKTMKLQKRDTVAAVMPNVPEYPILILAASLAGLKITTVNPHLVIDEIVKQLVLSDTKAVVTLSTLSSTISKAAASVRQRNVPVIVVRHEKHHSIPQGAIDFNELKDSVIDTLEDVNPKETFYLPYSSGTTGLPKGVELTHDNIASNIAQIEVPEIRLHIDAHGDTQDVVPIFLPMFHIYGMATAMLCMLAGGCKVVTVPKFGTAELLQVLKDYKPTVVHIVPPIVNLINKNPVITSKHLESLRVISSGAAKLGASDVERFKEKTSEKVVFIQSYGMTEASPVICFQSAVMEKGVKDGGIGFVVPNTEYKVVAVDDPQGNALGPHESGELYIRGPQVMKGYYKNEEATKQCLTEDGFLKTGDIVHFDEDHHLFVTDRLKELIKVKGLQVAPAELEVILRQHPEIVDAAVVGVPHPKTGEAPKAFVVTRNGSSITADEIKNYVASKVTSYKHLSGGVAFVESIPKNPSGKILRKEFRNI